MTVDPDKLGSRPSIRSYWFEVDQMLDPLAAGFGSEEIHQNFPFIEREDVLECLRYAAEVVKRDFCLLASA